MSRTVEIFLVLVLLWRPLRGAVRDITCTYLSPCVLPCPFISAPDVVIHWLLGESVTVHSFYHDLDQLGSQDAHYKGRTALFNDQISRGNASLLLSRVQLTDRGRYKCYTSTIKGNNEDIINVQVQAPVGEVELQLEGEELKCISNNIYPKPEVIWTLAAPEHRTAISESETGLYSVLSFVTLPLSPPHQYTCNVSTGHSWRSATYRAGDLITASDETTVPCADSKSPIKSLIWKFNLTQVIYTRTGSEEVLTESWGQSVDRVSESSLVLKELTSEQSGLYSCELRTDSETFLITSSLQVTSKVTQSDTLVIIIGSLAGGILLIAVVIAVLCWVLCRKKKKKNRSGQNGSPERNGML